MMRKNNVLKLLACAAIVFFSSCSGLYHYNQVNTTSFSPDNVRLDMDLSDFELQGSTTISVSTRVYFGLFKKTDFINDVQYNFREVKKVNLQGHQRISLSNDLRKAAYKVIEAYPNADFYVPVYTQKEVHRMFLGRQQTTTAVIKAFKLKSK
jgi:hypothetical protein